MRRGTWAGLHVHVGHVIVSHGRRWTTETCCKAQKLFLLKVLKGNFDSIVLIVERW